MNVFGYTSNWVDLGTYDYCSLSYVRMNDHRNQWCAVRESPANSQNWQMQADDSLCQAICFTF
ncbi:hypothetical protein ABRP79_00005, partial [Pectobacterium cacticida]